MGHNSAIRGRYAQRLAGMLALTVLTFGAGTARAAIVTSCTDCHGMPPTDAVRKGNPHFRSLSSAVLGNHQTHVKPAPAPADCAVCHQPVAATDFGHQNGVIAMANSLKGYSSATLRAKYSKGVFFNQTSIPNLTSATCSNVNCHFEAVTPAWGTTPTWSATGATTATCGGCHGAPPAGTASAPAGGLAGSHSRHNVYYSGITNCQKCHPATTGFSHATSAGRPLKVQGFLRDPGNTLEAGATYSGAAVNYLPSRSATPGFGSCSNLYCHSNSGPNGTARVSAAPTWGSAPLTCGSCHAEMSSVASTAPNGSHYVHASSGNSGGPLYACSVCHTGYTSTTVTTATHVNKQVELGFSGNGSGTTYSKAAPITAGTAWGSCSTSNCHGAQNPTWGNNTTKARCQKCHGYRSSGWNALSGATVNTDSKVGAHFNHISSSGTAKYGKPESCAECHAASIALATDNVNAVGHFDTAGPADISFGTLAKTGGQLPAYNSPAAGQCANVYCHGAGMASNTSNPPASRVASPTWSAPLLTGTAGTVGNGSTTPGTGDCSKCHGYPPMTATHAGKAATACAGCHSHVNATGTGFTDATKHINGVVDASGGHAYPYPGATHMSAAGATPWSACSGCHNTTSTGTYPVARGTAPNCRACHINGLLAPSGTSSCYDCHGATAADGQPKGNSFPNISSSHTSHVAKASLTCANCHYGYGSGSTRHGFSNTSTTTKGRVAFNGVTPTPVWTPSTNTCTNTCHGTAVWGSKLGCINCHAVAITRTKGRPGTQLAAVTTEFGLAWGHKKAGRGAVTDADCIVCHLEGNFTTQKTSSYHGDGNIDLRDPRGAGETPITNISGAAFTFQRFSTSYAAGSRTSTGHTANTIDNVLTQKFCLGCHRSSGATNPTARTTGGTAYMPWGGVNLGATYTVANGAAVAGGVVNVFSQFSSGNSSYHPVRAPLNRDFPAATRLVAPYNNNGSRAGTSGTKSLSVVINCFDCHNVSATAPWTTRTVVAHGNATTIRGTIYTFGGVSTLCTTCHSGYTTTSGYHGAGSAWGATGSSHNVTRNCQDCHGSYQTTSTAPARPIRAQDYHGNNSLNGGGLWPTVASRPYAFIRAWGGTAYHRPLRAKEFTTGSATCGSGSCPSGGNGGQVGDGSTRTYTPGGSY